jgi:hypothetical protein
VRVFRKTGGAAQYCVVRVRLKSRVWQGYAEAVNH